MGGDGGGAEEEGGVASSSAARVPRLATALLDLLASFPRDNQHSGREGAIDVVHAMDAIRSKYRLLLSLTKLPQLAVRGDGTTADSTGSGGGGGGGGGAGGTTF